MTLKERAERLLAAARWGDGLSVHRIEACLQAVQEEASTNYQAEAIAEWLSGLSRHPACPPEKRYWYQDVASDIRAGAYKNR